MASPLHSFWIGTRWCNEAMMSEGCRFVSRVVPEMAIVYRLSQVLDSWPMEDGGAPGTPEPRDPSPEMGSASCRQPASL